MWGEAEASNMNALGCTHKVTGRKYLKQKTVHLVEDSLGASGAIQQSDQCWNGRATGRLPNHG